MIRVPREKKVLLFVVEGPTEETALAAVLEHVFADNRVYFDVVHGDLTLGKGGKKDARERVRDEVLSQIGSFRGYGWNDLERIVQICDSDGAFIPDENVRQAGVAHIRYSEDSIFTAKPATIQSRNAEKGAAMRQLSRVHCLTYKRKAVPYALHFFSRNMEHALHGRGETLSNDEKIRLAHSFRQRYANDSDGFRELLESEDLRAPGSFDETWSFLEEDTRSLERWSNLHFALRE